MDNPFLVLAAIGMVITTVGLLRMRPLPEGSADKWLRILFIGISALIVWHVLRDESAAGAVLLAVCTASGLAASFLTMDRGQAAAGSSWIAMATVGVVSFVLVLAGTWGIEQGNWRLDALAAAFAAVFAAMTALIPASIAGWLAADFRNWCEDRGAARPSAHARLR